MRAEFVCVFVGFAPMYVCSTDPTAVVSISCAAAERRNRGSNNWCTGDIIYCIVYIIIQDTVPKCHYDQTTIS